MKTILAIIIATLSAGTAQAVEYPVVQNGSQEDGVLEINPTSLVEVTGFSAIREIQAIFTLADGRAIRMRLDSPYTKGAPAFTGVTSVRIPRSGSPAFVTLKITPFAEINPVAPATVLVLPENSTGNFDVVIEASDDLVSWLPFFSQTVNSQTAKKFFRTRVVRSQGPAPVNP